VPQLPSSEIIREHVQRALAEDIGAGDLTASLIPPDARLTTRVICREHAVLAGQAWFEETFSQLDPGTRCDWRQRDGDRLSPGSTVCELTGAARPLLSGERTALNFLQTLSAAATCAAQYVQAVKGTGATILDTRKTLPGLRLAQKYAVTCGGASNHRIGLFDAILIKENHIAAAGSISSAVASARRLHPQAPLEVEVETLDQLAEAAAAGAGRVLLDNFSNQRLGEAVALWKGRIELEASGGISLETVRAVAETGVDFISTGELTKHVRAVDFSMRYSD
jgi:nicotinate-nucleotide pyrophosphorylase (carboxylating)